MSAGSGRRFMGYDFYITRRTDSSDGDGTAIEREEWLGLASSLESLEPISESVVGTTTLKHPPQWHTHQWTAHPEFGKNGPQFRLTDGGINFRSDDAASMAFAIGLAQRLKATVMGEGGEEWTLDALLGPAVGNPINPFTKEPMFAERVGSLQHRAREWHLVSRRRTHLGLCSTEDRFLLHFVVSAPEPVSRFDGGTARLRGSLSKAGK